MDIPMNGHGLIRRTPSLPERAVRVFDRQAAIMTGVPRLEEIAVLAFAATRLTRAITLDEITAPLRDQLERKASTGSGGWVWASQA